MPTRTISITDEAYERLRMLKTGPSDSFSAVILRSLPRRKKLSEVLATIGVTADLADAIETASTAARSEPPREYRL
jgi:predicted CopG family antitoxin